METTNGQKREMKYCDCKKPKKNGGDNYCQICDGLIANLLEMPVLNKIAGLAIEANEPLLDVVNKAKTEMFDVELAMNAFVIINKKLKEILDLTKQ